MDAERETSSAEPSADRPELPSKAPKSTNGPRKLVDLDPGPEETIFRGIYPGFRDTDDA